MLDHFLSATPSHASVLKDDILKFHGSFMQFTEADFYPEHDKRKASNDYQKIHKKIVREENAGCVVCNVNYQLLSNPNKKKDKRLNPYQARQLELHHFHIEWALTNAIDVEKFNNLLKPHLARLHPAFPLYNSEMNQDAIQAWVDHHPHNLMPLCDVHHRHKYYGIHHVSYPNWSPFNLYKDSFIQALKEEIDVHP